SMQFTSEGKTRAVLFAKRIRNYQRKSYTLLDSGVTVDFFDREGKHSSRLTSQTARVDDNTKNMIAYGNVHIVSDSGTIVDTDSLMWQNAAAKLKSDAFVHIQEPSGRVTSGRGFESDQSLSNYAIAHPTIVASGKS